ncbi:PR domain zinc finger protein 14 [Molossus molossus]|uniref:PR domain zinc finger protein 14 n=1 Tax=Molossus molossus TaxID=27622 RepID=A0A7J8DV35_MOLMO|nr:PR domain zinc finger protein 14 [Molossus molossus]KAF6426742.1 PR/SET domain 14 [Molossus molossus]
MALRSPGEVCYPHERLQSSPQHLAPYYTPFPPYGPYGNSLTAAEENYQHFPVPAVSASQAVAPFALRTAPPLLSPGLALQREPIYDLPWPGKLPPWYPFPHFPKELQHFANSNRDYTGVTSEDLARIGGRSDSGPCYGPDIFIPPPPPAGASLVPEELNKRSEDDSKLLNQERKSTHRYHFTQEDLHLVLYGVIPSLEHSAHLHHAASGLLVPTDGSGSECLPQTLDQDSLQLPEGLCLRQLLFGEVPHFGVFCCSLIAKGVRFGPFQGKVVNASEVKTYGDNSLMWEIFEDGRLSHFIDGKGGAGNWMSYVNCARFPKEQNLVAVQCQGQIFYESCKDIYQNQELLVWYGDCYEKFLDIPVSLQVTEQGKQAAGPPEESAEGYRCDRCGKVFTYRYYRDKHLKYTPCVDKGDRKFPCALCKRSFEKRDRLRIHILHVHEKHRPHKCSTCGKCFSQSSSLNKHMRVHSGDRPYQCVYCTKKFTASSILRTHIRQHSGEKPFKCKHCGKAFASHAAHDSHVRRSHKEGQGGPCRVCGESPARPGAPCPHAGAHGAR